MDNLTAVEKLLRKRLMTLYWLHIYVLPTTTCNKIGYIIAHIYVPIQPLSHSYTDFCVCLFVSIS